MLSVPARYIHAADPVYQLQPPPAEVPLAVPRELDREARRQRERAGFEPLAAEQFVAERLLNVRRPVAPRRRNLPLHEERSPYANPRSFHAAHRRSNSTPLLCGATGVVNAAAVTIDNVSDLLHPYVRAGRPGVSLELRDPFQGPNLERRCVAGDGRFAWSFHMRNPAIERGDQFEQSTNEPNRRQRHRGAPLEPVTERRTFQTSPQIAQRQ
jgi:hypothetical protein